MNGIQEEKKLEFALNATALIGTENEKIQLVKREKIYKIYANNHNKG